MKIVTSFTISIILSLYYFDVIRYIFNNTWIPFLDDLLYVIISIWCIILISQRQNKSRIISINIIGLSILLTIGVVSHLTSEHTSLIRLSIGIAYFTKPFIFTIWGMLLSEIISEKEKITIFNVIVFTSLTTCFLGIIELLVPNIWASLIPAMYLGETKRVSIIWGHPGKTAYFLSIAISIILVKAFYERKIEYYVPMILCIILNYYTYMKKSFISSMVIIYYVISTRIRSPMYNLLFLILSVSLSLAAILNTKLGNRFFEEYQFLAYDIYEDRSRILMLVQTFELMSSSSKNMLFGVGFGNWLGYATSIEYSPFHYEYFLDLYYGLNSIDGSYLGDNYFAHVLGEIGIIGSTTTFILALANLVYIWKRARRQHTLLTTVAICLILNGTIQSLGFAVPEVTSMSMFAFGIPWLLLNKKTSIKST